MRHCRIWSSRGQTSGNFNLLDTLPRHALTTRPFQKNSFRLEYSVLTTLNWLRSALGKLVLLITGPHLWCCTDYFFILQSLQVISVSTGPHLRCCTDWLIRLSSVTWFFFACLCWTTFRSSITSGYFAVGVFGFSGWRSTTWHRNLGFGNSLHQFLELWFCLDRQIGSVEGPVCAMVCLLGSYRGAFSGILLKE